MQVDNGQSNPEKIPVGISSCLLGEEVRYDGGHKYNPNIVNNLGAYFRFVPFCPEMDIGLGVPREPVHLVAEGGITRCIGTKTTSLDVTARLSHSADNQKHWQGAISGYILKRGSPSCGMERVKLMRNGREEPTGVGIFASRMMRNFPLLPVEEEDRLLDQALRESFVQRVVAYHDWNRLCASGLSWNALTGFHSSYRPALMRRDEAKARKLDRELSDASEMDIDDYAPSYIASMMSILT